jgi:hypothetical protein
LEFRGHGLINVLSWDFPAGTEENHENSVRIAKVPGNIPTQHHLNANLWHHHYKNLQSNIQSQFTLVMLSREMK